MSLPTRLGERVDAERFQAFRILFGILLAVMPLRFAAYGWIDALYLEPTFHFSWVPGVGVASAPVMYALHGGLTLCGLLIATGRAYRPAVAMYFTGFLYLEALDKTLYLNHYVLVSLLLGWLLVLPVGPFSARMPRWSLWVLRVQFGMVWFWAGVCKINSDWLLRAEPLHGWLRSRAELPGVGSLLARWETAVAMSWGGMLFDLLVFGLLVTRRTRAFGIALLVAFHAVTGLLFPIGVFPWVMAIATVLFFDASEWARLRRLRSLPTVAAPVSVRGWLSGLVLVGLLAMPLRHLSYPGEVDWNERGFRFSWRVLLIEKTGFVDYRVTDRATDRHWTVSPGAELLEFQHVQMRTQPDLILQYAHHLVALEREAGREVSIHAHSRASLNGRPSQVLVRDDVDLATISMSDTGWIEPLHP